MLIGSSDGRRIAEKLRSIGSKKLPIHDRMGGQRLRSIGYEGSLTFLDEISNAIWIEKETTFRETLYQQYYKKRYPQTKTKTTLSRRTKEITEDTEIDRDHRGHRDGITEVTEIMEVTENQR